MHETSAPERIDKGTWKEVLSHREEIPETSEVEVKVWCHLPEPTEEEDELEGKTLSDLFEGRTGVLSFDPKDLARRSEEYLAHGFGALPEDRRTSP
jgi:hypothetical protein